MAVVTQEDKTFSDEQNTQIEALEKKFGAAAEEIAKLANKLHAPLYKERAEIVKDIKGFWLQVLLNYMPVGVYLSPEDQDALTYLTNLEALEDPTDSRKTVITFEFSENPYFSNTTLVKTFTPKPDAPDYSEYDVEEHSTHEKVKIDWKSDDKNLTKLQPTKGSEEDDEYEPGSFFTVFFESDESLAASIGSGITDELYPSALAIYSGEYDGDDGFEDVDDEEEDEEDE